MTLDKRINQIEYDLYNIKYNFKAIAGITSLLIFTYCIYCIGHHFGEIDQRENTTVTFLTSDVTYFGRCKYNKDVVFSIMACPTYLK